MSLNVEQKAKVRKARKKTGRLIAHLILIIITLLTIFPFFYVLLLSILPDSDALELPIKIIPSRIDLSNYARALERNPLLEQIKNSFIFSASTTALTAFSAFCAAYALGKLEIPGSRIILMFFITNLLFSPPMRAVPTFTFMAKLGWIDTWPGMIMPFATTGFAIFFLYQFVITIPKGLIEVARIDGAPEGKILTLIILPLSKTAISTIMLYNFLFRWRAFIWPLIMTKGNVTTLTVGIASLKSEEHLVEWNTIGATAMFLLVPSVVLFLFIRKHIMQGTQMTFK